MLKRTCTNCGKYFNAIAAYLDAAFADNNRDMQMCSPCSRSAFEKREADEPARREAAARDELERASRTMHVVVSRFAPASDEFKVFLAAHWDSSLNAAFNSVNRRMFSGSLLPSPLGGDWHHFGIIAMSDTNVMIVDYGSIELPTGTVWPGLIAGMEDSKRQPTAVTVPRRDLRVVQSPNALDLYEDHALKLRAVFPDSYKGAAEEIARAIGTFVKRR